MKKQLHIINIDGLEGVGQTTQINLLYKYFKDLGVPVLTNKLENTITSMLEIIIKTRAFLEINPNGVVLNDGSIAEMIVVDMTRCMPNSELIEKYREVINEHDYLSQDYGMCNLLLVPENIEMCSKRIIKRCKITQEIPDLDDLPYLMDIVKGMEFFDRHTISRQIKFNVINIEEHKSMLEVHNLLMKTIANSFEIKKPS